MGQTFKSARPCRVEKLSLRVVPSPFHEACDDSAGRSSECWTSAVLDEDETSDTGSPVSEFRGEQQGPCICAGVPVAKSWPAEIVSPNL